jgi:hypothetical protein
MAVRDFGFYGVPFCRVRAVELSEGSIATIARLEVGIRAGLFGVSMTPWGMVVNLLLSEPVGRQPLFAQM